MTTVVIVAIAASCILNTLVAEGAYCNLTLMAPCYDGFSRNIFADPSITTNEVRFCSVYSTFYHCMKKTCGGTLPAPQLTRVQQEQKQYGFYCVVSAALQHAVCFWCFISVAVFSTVSSF